ncbi:MAG: hypothetical protein JO040_05855 [Gemmatimonadetes bacterium]|nr:hypothetical protein [Gemmatimonadota bacterium]
MSMYPLEDRRPGMRAPSAPLGPYETSYDVRRGYDEDRSTPEPARAHRSREDAGWIGRPAER